MPKKSKKLAVLRESWRPGGAGDQSESRRRLAFRLAFSCLLLGLVCGFVYLVFSPFYHPTTRLYFLTAHPSKLIDAPPIPFYQEDAFRFLSADGEFHPENERKRFFVLESPGRFRQVMDEIEDQVQHQSDVAILYTAVQPYYLDGTFFLQCGNLDRTNPRQGILSLDELLKRAGGVGAGTVLLLLDIGPGQPGPVATPLNDIVIAIEQALQLAHQPSLWIMVSHAAGQNSNRSLEFRGTAFCQAVSLALEGQADTNRDRQIDLAEFQRYVTNYTQTLVKQVSGGAAVQTPRLLTSRLVQENQAQRLVLAPVPARNWQAVLASAAAAQIAADQNGGAEGEAATVSAAQQAEQKRMETSQTWLGGYIAEKSTRIKEMSIEELDDNLNFLPTVIGKRVRKLIGFDSGNADAEEAAGGEPTANPGVTVDASETTTGADPSGSDPADVAAAETEEPGTDEVGSRQGTGAQAGGLQAPGPQRAAPSKTATLPDLSPLTDERVERNQLLQTAWQYCHYLEQARPELRRPVDWAPHAWRSFVCNLHNLESRERLGFVLDPQDQRVNLTSEIVGSYQFAVIGEARVGWGIKRISTQMPHLQLQNLSAVSLGQAEQIAYHGGPPVDDALELQISRFDQAASAQDRKAFDTWIAQVPAEWCNQYVEFFWARQLAARGSIPWPVIGQCLRLARQYERIRFDPLSSNHEIQNLLHNANRVRLQGTRKAMDQIGGQWQTVSQQQLELAQEELNRVSTKLNDLRSAWQLRNETLQDATAILNWRRICVERLGNHSVDEDVELLLDNLLQISDLLLSRETASLAEVDRYYRQLRGCKSRIVQSWEGAARQLLAGDTGGPTPDAWLLDALLSTTLVRGEVRNQLLGLKLDKALSGPLPVDLTSDASLLSTVAVTDRLKEYVFASQVARLADPARTPAPPSGSEPVDAESAPTGDPLIKLDQFYRELPTQLQKVVEAQTETLPLNQPDSSWAARLRQLRQAELGLRLLEPNDAYVYEGQPLMTALAGMELWLCTQNQLKQVPESMADALPQETAFLRGAFARLTRAASALAGREVREMLPPPHLAVEGPQTLSLMSAPEATAEMRWTNVGEQLEPLWLVVEYDESLFEVEVASEWKCYHAAELTPLLTTALWEAEREHVAALTAATGEDGDQRLTEAQEQLRLARDRLVYPLRVAPSVLEPFGSLQPGQSLMVPYTVRRIGSGPPQAKIIWRLIGSGQYLRYETMVQLPVSERLHLVASGSSGSWSESTEGLILHPWANRQANFQLGISDSGSTPRSLRIDLLALKSRQPVDIPNTFLSGDASRELVRQLGANETLASIPELRVEGQQRVVWLPLSVPAVAAVATAGESPQAGVGDAITPGGIETATAALAAPLPSIRFGLVAMITDLTSKQVLLRRIDFRVRHPSSYVEVMAGYDAIAEKIEIAVRSSSLQDLPAEGVSIQGRIVEELPRGTQRKLEGSLTGDRPLNLYCQVPPAAPRELTVELDVDGFPRAFVFQVPCWRTSPQKPIVAQGHNIQILEPSAGSTIGPDATEIEVRLKLDTARGAFQSKQDAVEIGWDLDRDREFANEATIHIAADRQVDILLAALRDGEISVVSKVNDLVVKLPPPAASDTRVNLLARVTAVGETVWSAPVEVIVDSSPPMITGVELLPGSSFPQAADLAVRVGAEDANLSGIARVETVVSINGSSEFDSAGEPVQAERQPDGSWLASIPGKSLAPGAALLLVRAVDQVGLKSELSKLPVEIYSDAAWSDKQALSVQELSGSISYSGAELANAKLTLQNEQGEALYEATADDRGFFRMSKVKVGKYRLVGLGVAKNRPRRAEQEVELRAPPAPPTRVQLIAK